MRGASVSSGAATRSIRPTAADSCPVVHFARLADVPGIALFSLQVGPRADELASLGPSAPIRDLGPVLTDLGVTAATIAALDLVISVDTAPAHLAGALGRPVWTLLPHVPDWRWMLGRCDSPWYPTMRLFRQPAPGDWGAVFADVRQALVVLGGRDA